MNNTIESIFQMKDKEYCVVRSDTIQQRKYSLSASKGYPWMTYSGDDKIVGPGTANPALYSKADIFGRQFLFSMGPWWVDGNHSFPGYGYLSLVFLALLRPDKLHGMLFDPSLCYPNMREMKIRGKIRGHNIDLKGADFVFWFQSYSEKTAKNINYALIGKPLNDKITNGEINEFELKIDVEAVDDWVCLGSCSEKNHIYGDLDIKKLDHDKPVDMGFILTPIDVQPHWPDECGELPAMNLSLKHQWPIDISLLPIGSIAIYELEIKYYSQYQILQI